MPFVRTPPLIVSLLLVAIGSTNLATAQDDPALDQLLAAGILDPDTVETQHKEFVRSRIRPLKMAATAGAWQTAAARIRNQVLEDVVFRGVPQSWRQLNTAVQWQAEIGSGKGYRIRKLRFEAVPGLWIPALLYEPREITGKVPVVLNVNGHAATGKSTGYKQIRCINLAKRGMLALNLEWLGMGQLRSAGLSHNHLAKLDLCGCSGLSVFYLAMSRGLDVLLDHPHADLKRTAVTGLSGGGWQTIMLSSLDTRVRAAIPVAGYSAIGQRLTHRGSIGDLEQIPSDLGATADYVHLNALMVPRPLLMIYNDQDNCCFVSSSVKSNTYEPIVPFYRQAEHPERLEFYENSDPGTHNYELDNRRQLYRFLSEHFFEGQSQVNEIPSDSELKTADELHVELPEDNEDFDSLASTFAAELPRNDSPGTQASRRDQLSSILRYKKLDAFAHLLTGPKRGKAVSLRYLRIGVGDEWTLPGVIVEGEEANRNVVLLADTGFASQATQITELVGGGARVLAFDPTLIGQAAPPGTLYQNAMLIATVGERPLGLQAAQLQAVCEFCSRVYAAESIEIRATGARTSLVSRCAAALTTTMKLEVHTTGEVKSLKNFLDPAANYGQAPEAYCFGLLEQFDIDGLIELGTPRPKRP